MAKVAPPVPGAGGGFTPGPVPGPTKVAGSDGVTTYGGFVFYGERDQKLIGVEKYVTQDNIIFGCAIVPAAINFWTELGGSAKWRASPNPRASAKAGQRAVDVVTEGLFEAQMSEPWRSSVRRQLFGKKFRGFSLHELVIRRRSDGMVIAADLLHRPQWTIWRWNKPDEQSEWKGVQQLSRTGATPYIPRERLWYSVSNVIGGGPEGIGMLRAAAESARVLELYRKWELIGFQTELRGIPLARVPFSRLMADAKAAGAKTDADIKAYVHDKAGFIQEFLSFKNKNPEQGLALDSRMYENKDTAQAPSGAREWDFELVSGGGTGQAEVGAAIARETRDIARIMASEWMLLGDVGSGSDAMHEDKTAMAGKLVNSALTDLADDMRRDVATRLIALNGLDPETDTPLITCDPVITGAVLDAARTLMTMAQAALNPKDKAINVMRSRLDLPDAPEEDETELYLPRGMEVRLGPNGEPLPGQGLPSGPPAGAPVKPSGVTPTPDAPAAARPGQAGNVNARPNVKPAKRRWLGLR